MRDDRLSMAHYGYDGLGIVAGDRVELHPATDWWMRGARFGTVLRIRPNGIARVVLDRVAGERSFAVGNLRNAT